MNKTLRRSLLLLPLTMMAISLGACGNKKGGKTKVTFWHTMGQGLQEVLDRVIQEFNKKYPNVEIEHAAQGGYDDLEDKIKTAIPAGTTPTMAYCYPDHVAEYMESNAVIDMKSYRASNDGALFWESPKNCKQVKGFPKIRGFSANRCLNKWDTHFSGGTTWEEN